MDSLTQLRLKLLAEQARQTTATTPAPPPYSASDHGSDSDADSDDEDPTTTTNHHPSPMKLTINAAHSIQGSNNLIPTSPSTLADATKLSAVLLSAVQQINHAASVAGTGTRRGVKVELTINCGITVVGDRNVVGNVGLKPKAASPETAVATRVVEDVVVDDAVVAGAKRKADDEPSDEPEPKRVAVEAIKRN